SLSSFFSSPSFAPALLGRHSFHLGTIFTLTISLSLGPTTSTSLTQTAAYTPEKLGKMRQSESEHEVPPAAGTRFMIQEIWDHILSMLHGHTEALRSCALVCRALSFPAQSYLFHTIALARPKSGLNADIAASCWLAFYLRRSPHLGPLIRRLYVCFHPRILEQIAPMPLSQLRNIQFFPGHYGKSRPPLPHSFIRDALDIVARSSLTKLGLNLLTFKDVNDLESLFQTLGPNVNTISIRFTLIHDPSIPAITDLTVLGSPSVANWLASPYCPLNLAHLVNVKINSSVSAPLLAILHSSRSTIKRLEFADRDLDAGLDLALFPAVVHLHVSPTTPAQLPRLLPHLSSLKSIQTLHIGMHGFDGALWPERRRGAARALRCRAERPRAARPQARDYWSLQHEGRLAGRGLGLVPLADHRGQARAGRGAVACAGGCGSVACYIGVLLLASPQSALPPFIASPTFRTCSHACRSARFLVIPECL
ncbi:hypothetical protein DFH09DRAFT_1477069, partial [Mycena vulgaris]